VVDTKRRAGAGEVGRETCAARGRGRAIALGLDAQGADIGVNYSA